MGLDMYLRASQYVSRWDYDGNNPNDNNPLFKELTEKLDVVDTVGDSPYGGITISFPIGYWRKVNSVHNWFVNECAGGVDECQPTYVNRQHLEELKNICETVLRLKDIVDGKLAAEKLLPTASGFFFGSTDYDEIYYADLKDTVEIIDRCLKSKFESFEYQASW